jgi:hypothetical protein
MGFGEPQDGAGGGLHVFGKQGKIDMGQRKIGILLGLALCFLPGCITFFKYSGTEIKAAQVAKIQPGKTLKRDALKWFGAPITISAPGEIVVIPKASTPDKEYRVPRRPTIVESDTFFNLFSSEVELTEYHRVYYFYFSESRELMYFLILAMYDEIDTKFDKLWLLVDERTGIVEKYFFKEGIRPHPAKAKVIPKPESQP